VQVKRKIYVEHNILVAIKTELHIAKLNIPRVDLCQERRTLLRILKIGYVIELDLDKTVGMVIFTHNNHCSNGLVVFELVPHIKVCFLAVLIILVADLIVPFVPIQLRL
jgi:hypothetical protein